MQRRFSQGSSASSDSDDSGTNIDEYDIGGEVFVNPKFAKEVPLLLLSFFLAFFFLGRIIICFAVNKCVETGHFILIIFYIFCFSLPEIEKETLFFFQTPQGIVQTEKLVYGPSNTGFDKLLTKKVPVVETEVRKVAMESGDGSFSAAGEIVSSQTISSKTRTVETITVSI